MGRALILIEQHLLFDDPILTKKIKKNDCHHPCIGIISVLARESGYVFKTPRFHKLSSNKWCQLLFPRYCSTAILSILLEISFEPVQDSPLILRLLSGIKE
jgi:hypothetical protein